MNWEAIGAVGEVAGAIAVVVTLIYLGIQVRHSRTATEANTRSLDLQTMFAVQSVFGAYNDLIGQSPDLAALVVRGDAALSDLAPAELLRYDAYQARRMNAVSLAYSVRERGDIPEDFLGACVVAFLSTHGAREWWDGGPFDPEFRGWVNRYLANAPKGTTTFPELVDHLSKLQ